DLASIVTAMGHSVAAIADTHLQAVALARARRPGIVLADIQLRDGSSGIDAVKDILQAIDVPVIFVTAFPERLLTGECNEPTYLIAKPFDPDVLKVTINQALLLHPAVPAAAVG
ncbi:MAG TPA: response regulator, partial [Thermohalobaculum sp.]|nr:response regulator [Thermohalobaculum sp.]